MGGEREREGDEQTGTDSCAVAHHHHNPSCSPPLLLSSPHLKHTITRTQTHGEPHEASTFKGIHRAPQSQRTRLRESNANCAEWQHPDTRWFTLETNMEVTMTDGGVVLLSAYPASGSRQFAAPDAPGRCPVLKRRADQAGKTNPHGYTSATCHGRASPASRNCCALIARAGGLRFGRANVRAVSSRTQIRLWQINHFLPPSLLFPRCNCEAAPRSFAILTPRRTNENSKVEDEAATRGAIGWTGAG